MASCELCGKSCNNLLEVKVAASNVLACSSCASLGKQINPHQTSQNQAHLFHRRKKDDKLQFEVVSDYVDKINKSLKEKGYDIHILAKGTNIKESSLSKYLTNKISLDVDTARKIEKFLEITLVEVQNEKINEKEFLVEEEDSSSLSLGDLLEKQLKK